MKAFLTRWLVTTIAVFAAVQIIPGIDCKNWVTLIAASLILGIINAIVKPLLVLLSLPLVILTLGLFIPIINAFLLLLTSKLVPNFIVEGFWSALFGSLVISIVTFFINTFIRQDGRVQFVHQRSGPRNEKIVN